MKNVSENLRERMLAYIKRQQGEVWELQREEPDPNEPADLGASLRLVLPDMPIGVAVGDSAETELKMVGGAVGIELRAYSDISIVAVEMMTALGGELLTVVNGFDEEELAHFIRHLQEAQRFQIYLNLLARQAKERDGKKKAP